MNKHYTFQEYLEKFSSIQDSYDYYFKQQKEIDRLNNIISELEKYTIEQRDIVKENMQIIGNEGKRLATRFVVYNEYLDKLKELKEKENE